jgi:hypothetical protein
VNFFNQLGERIYVAWMASDFDEQTFSDIATRELLMTRPSDHVSSDEVLGWVLDTLQLPMQHDVAAKFGQPPVTVYKCDRFHIDVLFWVTSTTSIHQHGFSGAFHVLSGSSLQSLYKFRTEHRYCDRLLIGALELQSVEHLQKGDVRAIETSTALIHSLFHLEHPSVSVVVRTPNDPLSGPQYTYLPQGIAYDPFFSTDLIARQSQTLALLSKLDRRKAIEHAYATIGKADALRAFMLLDKMSEILTEAEYSELTGRFGSTYAPLFDRMRAHRDVRVRTNAIVSRRERVLAANHRFLLALLLNVPSRERILDIVRLAYPGQRPAKTVLHWVEQLAQQRLDDGRNALEIEMDETGIQILSHLVEGVTDEEVCRRLAEEFDDVDSNRDGVVEMCQAFRRSHVFRHLTMPKHSGASDGAL